MKKSSKNNIYIYIYIYQLVCLESRFAVCSDSNRHRFASISNRTIRIKAKSRSIAAKALILLCHM